MIIYLVDRVNTIERVSRTASSGNSAQTLDVPLDPRFGDTQGKLLWTALTSAPSTGVDTERLSDLRGHYEAALSRHIEELFEEGALDARQGIQAQPNQERWIRTATGQVQSWLPASDVRSIYDLGQDRERLGAKDLAEIRARLDTLCGRLFEDMGIRPTRSISLLLLPGAKIDEQEDSDKDPEVIAIPQTTTSTELSPKPKNKV